MEGCRRFGTGRWNKKRQPTQALSCTCMRQLDLPFSFYNHLHTTELHTQQLPFYEPFRLSDFLAQSPQVDPSIHITSKHLPHTQPPRACKAMSAAKTALLLAPAVTSTCTLLLGLDHDLFLRPLTLRSTYRDANRLLPAYWARLMRTGLPRVLAFLSGTAASSVAALALAGPLLRRRASAGWYWVAAGCAAAHLAWVPWVTGPIRAMVDDEGVAVDDDEGETNVDHQARWLRVNLARTLTTDLLGWACAMVAVTKTLAVE